jgi:hypothetical protein
VNLRPVSAPHGLIVALMDRIFVCSASSLDDPENASYWDLPRSSVGDADPPPDGASLLRTARPTIAVSDRVVCCLPRVCVTCAQRRQSAAKWRRL